jgi:hypothetical protein
VGLTTLPCKKKEIVEKPPGNSVGFCGDQGLSSAVEPRKVEEEEEEEVNLHNFDGTLQQVSIKSRRKSVKISGELLL